MQARGGSKNITCFRRIEKKNTNFALVSFVKAFFRSFWQKMQIWSRRGRSFRRQSNGFHDIVGTNTRSRKICLFFCQVFFRIENHFFSVKTLSSYILRVSNQVVSDPVLLLRIKSCFWCCCCCCCCYSSLSLGNKTIRCCCCWCLCCCGGCVLHS